jgi:DNA-binding Lrp family transcriptional regulator
MKDAELRLIAELMKNSRRSDRELSKVIGISQPTVSRTIARLEKEGVLKEYTAIPDFRKLGFEIMAVTFVSLTKEPTKEELKEFRKTGREIQMANPRALLLAMDGTGGLGFSRILISFHEDYSSYMETIRLVKANAHLIDASRVESFLVSLANEEPFQALTLSTIASYLLIRERKKK